MENISFRLPDYEVIIHFKVSEFSKHFGKEIESLPENFPHILSFSDFVVPVWFHVNYIQVIVITNIMAEVHGNRTHLRGYQPLTPDLKSGRPTSDLCTSVAVL
jgi:hypothetical protein